MPRKEKKYHVIYKTTCKVNGKYYIGMHSTDDLNDGYIGSGKYLWNSIRKHGKENFQYEILEYFDNRIELKEREKDLVNEELLKDSLCMNLKTGRYGGFFSKEACMKGAIIRSDMHKNRMLNDPIYFNKVRDSYILTLNRMWSDPVYRQKMSDLVKKTWTGRKHTVDAKKKMSDAGKKRIGDKNSQFGTQWITNGTDNKKISKNDIIPNNWKLGRIIKQKS